MISKFEKSERSRTTLEDQCPMMTYKQKRPGNIARKRIPSKEESIEREISEVASQSRRYTNEWNSRNF